MDFDLADLLLDVVARRASDLEPIVALRYE